MNALVPATSDAAAIGLGAFAGAMSRYQIGKAASDWIATDPVRYNQFRAWHTAAINVTGSFVLGCVTAFPTTTASTAAVTTTTKSSATAAATGSTAGPASAAAAAGLTPRAKLLLGVGFCGSFTTFSTYSVDVVNWIAEGKPRAAAAYVVTNNVGGVLAAAAGYALVKKLLK